MVAQANFIRGGLLLTVALHHSAGDATAIETILGVRTQNTAPAAASGSNSSDSNTFTSYDARSLDRSSLMQGTPPGSMADFPEYVLRRPARRPQTGGGGLLHQRCPVRFSLVPNDSGTQSYFFLIRFGRPRRQSVGVRLCRQHLRPHESTAAADLPGQRDPGRHDGPSPRVGAASHDRTGEGGGASPTRRRGHPHVAGAVPVAARRVPQTVGLLGSRPDPSDYKLAFHAFLGPDIVATSWADDQVYADDWGGELGAPEFFPDAWRWG
ncbi:hypothetical protein PG994_004099 [Apiospora phragmitis]|uniref:Uncharacterized protein n=1 Tax=Apiospora phragmitis TaxID=2905665 RepID=A0ABR1VPN1_9PEZI